MSADGSFAFGEAAVADAAEIKAADAKLADAEAEFKAEVEKLQKKYESLMQEKDEKEEAVKNSGLSLMKAVKKAKASGNDEL